ncbi:MAG: DNA/RNA nuclease SfsA, partial [Eubacteriales bacterium]
VPGTTVYCQHHDNPNRKTQWSLIAVQKGDRLINMDSQVPNALAEQWVASGGLGFVPENIKREKTFGNSRFDLYFQRDGQDCYMEVKGVTLEVDGFVRFPDAPTQRGVKHMTELCHVAKSGLGAYVLFVVQMDNVSHMEPNWVTDPDFGKALQQCQKAEVSLHAVCCAVTPDTIETTVEIPLILEP